MEKHKYDQGHLKCGFLFVEDNKVVSYLRLCFLLRSRSSEMHLQVKWSEVDPETHLRNKKPVIYARISLMINSFHLQIHKVRLKKLLGSKFNIYK